MEQGGDGLWQKLRRRKVVQWGIACSVGAWGFLQGLEYVSEAFGWPGQLRQVAILALLVGLPVVVVIAWYHGDRGAQWLSGVELTIITLLHWEPGFPRFRNSPAFKAVLERLGIPAYWREHGYPPQCRAVGKRAFTCD